MNMNHILKAIEYARDGMFVPKELTLELVSGIKCKKSASILVMFSYEMLPVLWEAGYTNVSLVFDKPRTSIYNIVKKFGNGKVYNLEEIDAMKFDVVIGNPPFSKVKKKTGRGRGIDLYPEFYSKALDLASTVAMIMPSTHNRVMIKHNDLLKKTANEIVFISGNMFPNITRDMWYVVVNGSEMKPDVKFVFDSTNNSGIFDKGKLNVTTDAHLLNSNRGDVTVYHKLNSRDGVISSKCSQNDVPSSKRFPSSGYAVLMPQQITNTGFSITHIVKCDGNQAAMNGVNIAFVDTKKEAVALIEFMKTQEFIDQALKYVGGLGNMILTAMNSIDMSNSGIKMSKASSRLI